MIRVLRSIAAAFCVLVFATAAGAQSEDVGTGASATATYGSVSQGFGPYPWNDFGIEASASVGQGVLNVTTGGATTFKLPAGTVTPSETFIPGATTLNLGYTPNWTGSFSAAPAATGKLNSSFVYNLGPLGSGSDTILNVSVPVLGLATGHLTSSLNAPIVSPPVTASQTTSTFPVGFGVTAKAQVCFIVCATVASASISFNVSAQTSQTVVAAPSVVYGDLEWVSTTQTYSSSDTFTFVNGLPTGPGNSGKIPNVFEGATGLSLTSGQTFYYNFLPVVELTMPVVNSAQLGVPASITASYEILGAGGSETFPLGDLYELSTGATEFDFNPTFDGDEFYSIPLIYTLPPCNTPVIACPGAEYETPSASSGIPSITMTTGGGTVPSGMGPDGCLTLTGCELEPTEGPGIPTNGYQGGNLGDLFPNTNVLCAPPAGVPPGTVGTCTAQVNTMGPTPEPGTFVLWGIGLLGLGMLTRRKLCS
jgi:hypothetical protein